jgi:hypothetical protein
VPFTYSAEAFPLYIRDIGMSYATALTWFLYVHNSLRLDCRLISQRSNFVVAITFPRLLGAFKPQGAFGWYAGWNIIGFFAILLFVPETKALSLEELDQGKYPPTAAVCQGHLFHPHYSVFSVPTQTHAAYQIKALPHNIKKYIFRMEVDPLPPLYQHEGAIGEKHYAPGGAGHA